MRITQGTFSYLPDFTDDEIAAQIQYAGSAPWLVNGVMQVNVWIPNELIGDPAVPVRVLQATLALSGLIAAIYLWLLLHRLGDWKDDYTL